MQSDSKISEFLASNGYTGVELRSTPLGHLELDAIVDGNLARMVVDTGAGVTVIDRTSAQRWSVCGEATGDTAVAGCVGDIGGVDDARVGRFELAGLEFNDLEVKIMDLAQVNNGLEEANGERIDGIIGSDLMVSRAAVIEYAGKRLHLRTSPN